MKTLKPPPKWGAGKNHSSSTDSGVHGLIHGIMTLPHSAILTAQLTHQIRWESNTDAN